MNAAGGPGPEAADGWQVLGHGTLNSRIRGEILRVVTARRLSPGERLPAERELAAALQVSRPSVREAVRSLEAEGVLVVRHGQGVFLSEADARKPMRTAMEEFGHSLVEMFALREVLEVPAARWAAERRDEQSLSAIQEAYDILEAAAERDSLDFNELQSLDSAFHQQIVRASGNRLLHQTHAVLHDLMSTGMRTTLEVEGRLEQSRIEHQRILEALLAGEPATAGEAAQLHVRGARDAADRRIADAAKETP